MLQTSPSQVFVARLQVPPPQWLSSVHCTHFPCSGEKIGVGAWHPVACPQVPDAVSHMSLPEQCESLRHSTQTLAALQCGVAPLHSGVQVAPLPQPAFEQTRYPLVSSVTHTALCTAQSASPEQRGTQTLVPPPKSWQAFESPHSQS